jgi:hypothetical protein
VNKVALGQVFSEYLFFPCQFAFHQLLHNHHRLSSETGTIGQRVTDVPSGLSLTPPQGANWTRLGVRVAYVVCGCETYSLASRDEHTLRRSVQVHTVVNIKCICLLGCDVVYFDRKELTLYNHFLSSSSPKMEAASSTKVSATLHQTTWRHTPQASA